MPERTSLDDLTATPHADVFDDGEPRTIRVELDAGERIPTHSHPGKNVVVHLLSGRLGLALDDETYDLEPGDLVRCSGDRDISPQALEASTAIVVLAPEADDAES